MNLFVKTRWKISSCLLLGNLNQLMLFPSYSDVSISNKTTKLGFYRLFLLFHTVACSSPHHSHRQLKAIESPEKPKFCCYAECSALVKSFQGSHCLLHNCRLPGVPWELSLLSSVIIEEVHLLQGGCLRCADGWDTIDASRHHLDCFYFWMLQGTKWMLFIPEDFVHQCLPLGDSTDCSGRLSGAVSPVWFVFPSWCCPYSCLCWQGKNATWLNASHVPKGNDSISTLHLDI